jgi:hypothetical protein
MVFLLLSAILTAIAVAISIFRHRISFGSFTRSGIAREDFSVATERADQSRIAGPMKQFLVVVWAVTSGYNLSDQGIEWIDDPFS